jgi:hypothetical protein
VSLPRIRSISPAFDYHHPEISAMATVNGTTSPPPEAVDGSDDRAGSDDGAGSDDDSVERR